MKQFDVYANTDKDTNKAYPYFVDIQNGLLESLNSRVVIPLTPASKANKSYPSNLCPIIKIKNKNFFLLTHQLTSVSTNFLKKHEGSLATSREDIVSAIDFLITGI
ncbi:CcdB family protein [Dasania sp. GY-MA-18]|uniref:Toxin CcdB n=1 Tax=Dasania phycosphaerae TaxID=2950436 RepID=A0A9J6RPX6_9GAMM|nr:MULTISPECIES: CcdB family protein [Dasania]MCR8923790.1 CcdB family protein [Dasania sp. GY-MA-18]MCZ0866224.1 CcdB family protein [Dasania phycosphaerae]MCZ0869948.1 CcdB family protein [Dasania phycosphaerae]